MAIERFSKVTHFLKGTLLGQSDLIDTSEYPDAATASDLANLMESCNGNLRETNNDGFEVIYKVCMRVNDER